jgi:hypothetical protein
LSAIFSEDRVHRYVLVRYTEHSQAARRPSFALRTVAFIGLNPSTADEVTNDPTVRRCISYATRWDFERMVMLNVFAYRSTDPRKLKTLPLDEAVGPENDRHLLRHALLSDLVVCAWGAHAALGSRGEVVRAKLDARVPLYVLGLTKDGHPKHPLYLRSDLQPVVWD